MADPQRLLLSTLFQLWRFENIVQPGQNDGSDRHYIPRHAHTTGDLDIHDVGVLHDGRIIFVNTLFTFQDAPVFALGGHSQMSFGVLL